MRFKKKILLSIILLSILIFAVSAVSAADGTFDEVQSYIEQAQDGDILYLNNTTYTYNGDDGGEGISISNKKNIVIYGGNSSNPYLTSTLDGKDKSRIFQFGSGVRNITFIGINFINAKSTGFGGAIYFLSGSRNSWVNCTFTDNNAESSGGAIYFEVGARNSWVNCTFMGNTATNGFGGAISFLSASSNSWINCSFLGNKGILGGAISFEEGTSQQINNNNISYCIFDNNTATEMGKAIFVHKYSITDAVYFDNNFWGTNNTISADEFKNLGLITDMSNVNYAPGTFIVLNINTTGNGYTLYFARNGTTEDVTGEMPDYISNVKFNDTINVNSSMGKNPYPDNLEGDVDIDVCSLFSGNLLAETQSNIVSSTVTATVSNITFGENATVTVTVELNTATGNVTVYINDQEFSADLNSDGTATVTVDCDDWSSGEYTFNVTYSGDDNFNKATSPNYVLKIKDIVNVTSSNVTVVYGETATITISVTNTSATGNVTVHINDQEFNATLSDGTVTVTLTGSDTWSSKEYTFNVTYEGDDNFANATSIDYVLNITRKSVSDKLNITIPSNGTYSDICVNVTCDNVTGEVIIFINGTEYKTVNVIDGTNLINIPGLGVGTYNVTVEFVNPNYETVKANNTLNVEPKNLTDDINITIPENISCGDNKNITVDLGNKNATGNITVKLIDEDGNIIKINGTLNDGKTNITIPTDLPVGNYTINIDYNSTNGNFTSLDNVSTGNKLIINPIDVSGKVDITIPTSITEGDKLVIIVNCDNITGYVNVTVDGKTTKYSVSNGSNSFDISNLARGNHNVKVVFFKDSNYKTVNKEVVVNVTSRVRPTVDLDLTVNGTDLIVKITPMNATGSITIQIGNKTVSGNIIKGSVIFTDTGLVPGNYTAHVIYSGDKTYNSTSKDFNFTVSKIKPKIIVPDVIAEGDDLIIKITPENATGQIIVTVNNKTYKVDIKDGIAVIEDLDLGIGGYIINVKYSGDYGVVNLTKSLSVKENIKDDLNITVPTDIKEGENITINITVPENVTGNITVVIDGKNYTGNITNGTVEIIIPPLGSGVHDGTVIYSGDGTHAPVVKDFSIAVKSVIFTGTNLTKFFGGPERYTVTLTENGKPLAGETITITVIGKSYTRVTDENGTASLGINLSPGVYNITATWKNLTVKNTVIVKTTTYADDITKYYRNGTQYEAYVTDSEGNPLDNVNITFNIVGVFYTRTAHNGVVKLNINLSPGEYIITALNDVTGEQSSATVTVLPTLVGSDLNMTYKDGSKYECKLVDGQGNPVKDAELIFNIVGVFYHKTTDENGIARLNINLLPSEYIITAIYGSTMTSNIITVRDL